MSKYILICSIIIVGLAITYVGIEDAFANSGFSPSDNIVPREIVEATKSEANFDNLVKTILNYFFGFLGK